MTKYSIQKAMAQLHADILCCVETCGVAFQRLRYEGVSHLRSNVDAASSALQALLGSLMACILLEENEIFPYISKHIPRYEAMLCYFRSEHQEFKERLRLLKERVDALAENPTKERAGLNDFYIESLYLASHVRVHIQDEKEKLYLVIDDELHESEKKTLLGRIGKVLRGGRAGVDTWKRRSKK